MKNIVNPIPSTIDELKQNTGSFKTKSEQIEYLAEIKYVFQRDMSQDKNIENCDLDDAIQDLKKKLEHPERVDIEQIRSMYKMLSEVRDTINSNKKDPENYSSDKKKIIKSAEKEINNLGGKPEKWIEYPLVTNITDYNEIKRSMKEEGRLNEWVEWMLSNVEPSEKEHIGIKEIPVWIYNDSVIRQAILDCIEQDKEYYELLCNALHLDDEFVEHLKRQLKKEDVTVSRGVSTVKFFPDKRFHELVLRTMKEEGTDWNTVKRKLNHHTKDDERILIIEVSNHEGDMRPQIQFSTEDSIEPYKVMESTFKKKLTAYRKYLRQLPLPSNNR